MVAPEWVPAPMRLSTAPGMHRFVWDLHYPSQLPAEPDSPQENSGVWAPPGQYTVELQVNGQRYRQPLQLKADPRVKVSPAALQREFELARKVEEASARAAGASAEAGKLLKALDALPQATLHAQVEALMAKSQDLSGMEAHPDPRNAMGAPPRRTDSLRALSTNLAKLEQAVDGADADPSRDAMASYATLSRTLEATLEAWQRLKRGDLADLNARLKAAGAQPIAL